MASHPLEQTVATQSRSIAGLTAVMEQLQREKAALEIQIASERKALADKIEAAQARANKLADFMTSIGIDPAQVENGYWPTKVAALIEVTIDEANFEKRVGPTDRGTKEHILTAAKMFVPKRPSANAQAGATAVTG